MDGNLFVLICFGKSRLDTVYTDLGPYYFDRFLEHMESILFVHSGLDKIRFHMVGIGP